MRRAAVLLLVTLVLCGCHNDPKPTVFQSEPHDHSHEREAMLIEHAGRRHAALTAHLSQKDGNELDVFFETGSNAAKPYPLSLMKFAATARTASGQEHPLAFEAAPPDERKGDPDGKCSHFVAKAGWMKPEDVLTVTAAVEVDGAVEQIEWKNFNPRKYAHHVE
ncbi:hypothetical protein R5W24_006258 [Gemmata sp. JC717]|uniref:hypothetical protein n=1 Tax=Gemmata algarum TaxID=2975278 RepID=UPI0021BAB439|nr:hypothetical protein [Gemmata algarum]MDY3557073.1 hypothetical protein [Gemmata algarum]